MMTQPNSPGSGSVAGVAPALITALIWCIFGLIVGVTTGRPIVGVISALSFMVANVLICLDLDQRSSLIRWHPWLTLWAAFVGLLMTYLLFRDIPSTAIGWTILTLILNRSYLFPKDSKKSRKARDIGV